MELTSSGLKYHKMNVSRPEPHGSHGCYLLHALDSGRVWTEAGWGLSSQALLLWRDWGQDRYQQRGLLVSVRKILKYLSAKQTCISWCLSVCRNVEKDDNCMIDWHNWPDWHFCYRTQFGTKCNFTAEDPEKPGEIWDKCRVWSQEGIAFNVHQCMDDSVEVRLKLLLCIS